MNLLSRIADWFCAQRRHDRMDESGQREATNTLIREHTEKQGKLDEQVSEELKALSEYDRRALDLIHRRAQIRNRYRDHAPDAHDSADARNGGHAAGGAA
jgi:hypothetical protein